MSEKSTMSRVRKWSRTIHRDLSYLFAGALLVYAVSGICLNHKKDFNSDYIIRLEKYAAPQPLPAVKDGWTKEYVLGCWPRWTNRPATPSTISPMPIR